jgi:peptide-methionine (R)-S-oxide reductase
MRLPSVSTLARTFYTFTNVARFRPSSQRITSPVLRSSIVWSMPTIPFLGSFFGSSSSSAKMTYPDQRSDQEWQAVLNKGVNNHLYVSGGCIFLSTDFLPPLLEQFRILREKGTEAPNTGEYDKHSPESGVYTCAGCNAPLYKANHKFQSGCGWPAYFDSIPGAVTRHTDSNFGMTRTEIVCSNCGGHLGHVFKGEGYKTPTNERHCVNSVSLKFSEEDKKPAGDGSEGNA